MKEETPYEKVHECKENDDARSMFDRGNDTWHCVRIGGDAVRHAGGDQYDENDTNGGVGDAESHAGMGQGVPAKREGAP